MSVAESDLGNNGNGNNGNHSNSHESNSNSSQNPGSLDSSTTANAKAGDNTASSHVGPTQPTKATPEDGTGEDCLAQAQVQMPWLDFNAKLQVRGKSKKKESPAGTENTGFKLPGFSIRNKEQKKEQNNKKTHGGTKATDSAASDDWPEQDLSVPKKKTIWGGWDGLSVTVAGVALPALLILVSLASIPKRMTLVLLNHPLETIAEILLIMSIPLANYVIWSSLCKNKVRFPLLRGLALGSAIGTALVTAGVCIAAVFAGQQMQSEIGTEFGTGFIWIALLFLLAGAVSAYLANRIRLTHDFAQSRLRILTATIVGSVLALIAFVGAEARPWYIRIAEEKALSNVAAERIEGWQILRTLNPEKEILMECSDSRAAGICGLFLPIKSSTQHQLYFALTGKPYSFKDIANTDLSSMPDDYLSRHVVGDKMPGLSITRSSMTGLLHPSSLSSTLDWTFVFKNQGQSAQEARGELGLPPGAVITGLTLWNKGEPEDASFAASGKAEKYVTAQTTAGHDSPAIITDLGHGRVLLHCYPVRDGEELKVRLRMVVPLKPDGARSSTLALPRLIAENFEVGAEHQIRLRANQALTSSSRSLTQGTNPDGTRAIYGSLTTDQIENANVLITVNRDEFQKPVAVLDKLAIEFKKEEDRNALIAQAKKHRHYQGRKLDTEILTVSIDGSRGIQKQFEELANALERRSSGPSSKGKARKTQIKAVKPEYVVENVNKIAAPAPKNLMVVLDGSATVKDYRAELLNALSKIPENVPTRVLIAAHDDKAPMVMSVREGLEKLSSEEFIGGYDNLRSVVKASELAGETDRGAVLWIHGPQPVLNQEIYIMAPYVATPSFYELPLGAGDTDTYDFFKNHTEIGPFSQVPRSSRSVSDDLLSFFSKWRANLNGYEVSLGQVNERPDHADAATAEEGAELLALHANQQVKALVLARHIRKAARIAVAYGLVTPVSCALVSTVSNNDTDIEDAALANKESEEAFASGSPVLFANALPGSVPASAPSLAGATNGTIGPQGSDAMYVTGVNTAGTVRVNNLANLEAFLNIIANLAEVGCALLGGIIVLHSLVTRSMVMEVFGQELELGQGHRIAIGIGLLLFGLACPGLINWFVASARDANLFS